LDSSDAGSSATESTTGSSGEARSASSGGADRDDGGDPGEAVTPAPGDHLEGRFRYRLERRLGRGGFGSVFEARCLGGGTGSSLPPSPLAVKVLSPTGNSRAAGSLKRELAALLAIQHDRIPTLYDWSLEGQTPFVALEYFPAGSLADAWHFLGRVDEEQIWRLISDLLSALNAAHRSSVLHLDVKPSNVLLDGNGGFVLTDFGVSHASRMSKGLLHQGQLAVGIGTHGYRAPEQDSRTVHSFDLRTDLWGVGATAWALYTGIDLNKRQDVLRNKELGNIYGLQALSDVRLSCPPPLEEVVMGLLYIDPERRPGGAAEVLTRVRAVASGFGLDSQTVAAARRVGADPSEVRAVLESLVDPLWASICRSPGFERYFVRFENGEILSRRGEQAHHTLLLLSGKVRVEQSNRLIDVEEREGAFLGAISTLAGAERKVTLRAEGTVWTCIFNEAELEQLVTCNPAVAVRMIRYLAGRIASGPPRHQE
jgi:serine/threonine protein kinase